MGWPPPGCEDVTDCLTLAPPPGWRWVLCRHQETVRLHDVASRCVVCRCTVRYGDPMPPYVVRMRGPGSLPEDLPLR